MPSVHKTGLTLTLGELVGETGITVNAAPQTSERLGLVVQIKEPGGGKFPDEAQMVWSKANDLANLHCVDVEEIESHANVAVVSVAPAFEAHWVAFQELLELVKEIAKGKDLVPSPAARAQDLLARLGK